MSGTVGRDSWVMGAVDVSGVFWGVGAVIEDSEDGMLTLKLMVSQTE